MNVKDVLGKISGIIGKLPFVKLAEKIPEGARTKLPFLNALIPLANHIATGAAIVVLISCLGGGGGGGLAGTEWQGGVVVTDWAAAGDYRLLLTFGRTEFTLVENSNDGSLNDGKIVAQGTYKVTGNKGVMYTQDGTEAPFTIGELTLTMDNTGQVVYKVK